MVKKEFILKDFKLHIIQSCYISNASIYLNGNLQYNFPTKNFETFAENAYKNLDIKYPKFYKMDNLSKLGFLCAETVLQNIDLNKYSPEKIAINIINKNSSIDTDIKYNNLIAKGASSPAIFVYSLPNIMIGEICIRHNIQGDNLLFVDENYNTEMQFNYIKSLFENNKIEAGICGYIDYIEDHYEAFLFLVEKNHSQIPFTQENINQLYKTILK